MTLPELLQEADRLSDLLDKGVQALIRAGRDFAEAEHAYRSAYSVAYLRTAGTVAEREAKTYDLVGDARLVRDLADGNRVAALEAVRSRRAQLSALQSILAAHRAEAEFERVGPRS